MAQNPHDSPELRKARGAFFTPPEVAQFIVEWAIRERWDRVLEPSCGEAVFLVEAGRRLSRLGAPAGLTGQLSGAELHGHSAQAARMVLDACGYESTIALGDFLASEPEPTFDAVIGNPPYVRYQAFSGASRTVAKRAALRAGVVLTNLASSWAAFTVQAALHVRSGGRLGLVLPAEMLTVNYAAPVRDFLLREFDQVRLVLFTERVFPGVMEDVVLLLAEGRGCGPSGHFELFEARNGSALKHIRCVGGRRWDPKTDDRWSNALLAPEVVEAYRSAISTQGLVPLERWGDTTLGMVTGNNKYFSLTGAEVQGLGLGKSDVIRLSPPGSRHLRGLSLTANSLRLLDKAGQPTWLFRPRKEPTPEAWRYIAAGEASEVHQAYKCRVRSPWWRVPYVRPADLFLTYMNADTVRLCRNAAGVHHLNSIHGLYLRDPHRTVGRELLSLASLNSVSMLGAELVGRAYGGGVLKMEPREADRWPMPSPELVSERYVELRASRRQVSGLLRVGRVFEAAAVVDEALFAGESSIRGALAQIRNGRASLHDRRVVRSRSK